MKLSRPAVAVAEEKYPASRSLQATYVRGVTAQQDGKGDADNPYRNRAPATGFIAAHRNAWYEGWRDAVRGDVTSSWADE